MASDSSRIHHLTTIHFSGGVYPPDPLAWRRAFGARYVTIFSNPTPSITDFLE